jgi:hypothetical protein
MFIIAFAIGGLGAIVGLIAYFIFWLCDETRRTPKPKKIDYRMYPETEKDRLLKEKDEEIRKKNEYIKLLEISNRHSSSASSSSSTCNNDIPMDEIARQVSKGVRDGIARSQLEHGESIGNYGYSNRFFE